eukprot:CAMPEP_0197525152 /NCGR_PEP_ID=MMETSP1318-20131121/10651_1 /TAXON_ID=552666 /ORGANISM="Partenskyella glossopodia, Strain RCC365" /LENGTH=454 /DNA_ID=CAMNT_0043078327 /DNA_START=115 /DNA_END=1479 /DNA_ORIENTATION=-
MTEALQSKLQQSGAWQHLANTLMQVIKEQPNDPLAIFESLSQAAEKNAVSAGSSVQLDAKDVAKAVEALGRTADALYKPPAKPVEGEEEDEPPTEEPVPTESWPFTRDLTKISSVFGCAGVNFGHEETYKLSLAINSFAVEQTKAENVYSSIRFFGKVLGTTRNYYIVECSKKEWDPPAEDTPLNGEPMGKGVNAREFWATNLSSPSDKWTKLPELRPELLKVAVHVRRLFTGDLEAEVKGYPYFKWKEAGYLRAQIAQITHETVVSPTGVYMKDEEEIGDNPDGVVVDPKFEKPRDMAAMLSAKMWCHHRPYIISELGMCSVPGTEDDDEEAAEAKKQMYYTEEILTTLDKSKRSAGTEKWRFSLCSALGVRPSLSEDAAVCAQSLVWPGAYCVVKGNVCVNVYVGNGLRKADRPPIPADPPTPAKEFKLVKEQEDPILMATAETVVQEAKEE